MKSINARIKELESQLTGNLLEDCEIKEEIMKLKREVAMEENPLPEREDDRNIECVGCGS